MIVNAAVIEKLAEHEFLAGIDEAHLETLASFTYQDELAEGEYLFRAGEPAEQCYFTLDGMVSLEVYDPRRGSVKLEQLGGNRALGWSWLIPPHQWTFDARVMVTCRFLALDARRFRDAMDRDHELGYVMLQRFTAVFADRLRASRLRLLDMYNPVA